MAISIAQDRAAQLLMAREPTLDYDAARSRLESSAIVISADDALPQAEQATLLAAAACAVRMFQGGVFLSPNIHGHLIIGVERLRPLRRALEDIGASPLTPPDNAVRLHVGRPSSMDAIDLCAWTDGWRACISSVVNNGPEPVPGNVISGVLAGALAIAELFRKTVLDDVLACRGTMSLSAWGAGKPKSDAQLSKLPKAVWLLGLGNLGQAAMFTLGLLPWEDPALVTLLLNDADRVGPENLPVQVLSNYASVGLKKARAIAAWAEARGFYAIVDERRFSASTTPGIDEPRLAIVGVDNLEARRFAAGAGFDLVIDAGLGATGSEAFDIRLHAFPGSVGPEEAWPQTDQPREPVLPPNYEALIRQGRLDRCGAVTIAGKSIGVPCTAMAAAALQVAQVCRALATGRCCEMIDVSLTDLKRVYSREMPSDLQRLPATVNARRSCR